MRIYLFILIAMITSSCSPRMIAPPNPTQVNPPVEAPAAVQTADTVPNHILSFVIDDLSARLSVDPSSIQVISAEPIIWPNSSLGCPRPGDTYTQQTVPGYQILVEVQAQQYIYHTDADTTVILCIEDDLPSFPVTPSEINDGEPWMPVD